MAEKRVSVRIGATGGDRVKKDLADVGEAGERGFARLAREAEAASGRLEQFARRAKLAAAAAAAAAVAGAGAMVRSGLQTIDAQAKLAQSLETTVASVQTLERAGELAGVSMSGIEQATKDLSRRLSQAATGTGPVADALDRLGLSASQLIDLPLDERVGAINAAIAEFIPQAERAAVAGQLFGEEGSIAMSRIDAETLRQATIDVRAFGVAVSDFDADQVERTNDAISRLGLVWQGLTNRLTVAVAPALEAIADALAEIATGVVPALGQAVSALSDNLDRLATYAATFAAFMARRWVAGLVAATISVRGLATALVVLRGALIRTGIGAVIVLAGELVYQFGRLVAAAGGFGEAMKLMGDVAAEVWQRVVYGSYAAEDSLAAAAEGARGAWLGALGSIADRLAALLDYLGLASGSVRAFADEVGRSLDRSRILADILRDSAAAWGAMATAPLESMGALRDLLAETGDEGAASIDKVVDSMDRLNEAAGGGSKDKGGKSSDNGAKDAVKGLKASVDDLDDGLDQVKSTAGSAFTDIVTGASKADDAIKRMLESFAAMAAESAFDGLFDAVLGGGSGGGGGIGGLIVSSVLRGIVGGAFGGPDLTADPTPGMFGRAGGGPVRAGQLVEVNEGLQPSSRREWFVPGIGGAVLNVPQAQAAVRDGMKAGGAAGALDVRVFMDRNFNLRAQVENISGSVAAKVYEGREPETIRAVEKAVAAPGSGMDRAMSGRGQKRGQLA